MGRAGFRNSSWSRAFGAAAVGLALAASPVQAQSTQGGTFLKAVRERDGTKVTEMLNQPGSVLVNSRDQSNGQTALYIAVERRDTVWTQFLLDKGADPNIGDRNGSTPLALAVNLGFADGVEALVNHRARLDEPNSAGETPLIAAVHRRDVALIRLLMKGGANPDRTDNSGRSAREYAQLAGGNLASEIARIEADRKAGPALKTYGPIIQ